jgi:ribosomal protein S12 methylthiotransferase
MEIQREISLDFNRSRVGAEVRVLVDDMVDGTLVCRSEYESPDVDGEILIRDPAPGVRMGDMIRVRILAAEDYDLIACQILE